jgi:2OG-Fe(II) oxygenase superfamily
MLAPSLAVAEALSPLQAAWRERRSLRVAPFLDEEVAAALLDAARAQSYTVLCELPDPLAFQYLVAPLAPEAECDHLLCRFGRWLWDDGVQWVSALTGTDLAPPDDRQLLLTHYDKGSYLDPHNDYDGRRKLAFIIGLTEDTWPAEDGGHLEFLSADGGGGVRVIERRPPGWNTLDLFDVSAPDRPHAVPIVRRRAERRAIGGWFY